MKCIEIDQTSDHDDCRCISKIGYKQTAESFLNDKENSPEKMIELTRKTPAEIYEMIEDEEKENEFFIENDDDKTWLRTAKKNGTKYVKTEQNDTSEDNLLKQDRC